MDGFDRFYSELCGLRDGGLAGAKASDRTLAFGWFEFHSRAIVGSAKVSLVADLHRGFYFVLDASAELDTVLRQLTAFQASLNDWLESGRRALVYSFRRFIEDSLRDLFQGEEPSYAVVVSAVVLLSLVYQYLTGNVDTGSSKAYSRNSLDFRDIYVAVVLFLGAYVWIKFREVAPRGVHERKIFDKRGRITKLVYEPRFKPPRENGTVFQWIYLGQYATPEEASILYQIAAFYYNEGRGGSLDLGDGRWFSIPPMSEGERSLSGAEKRAWVKVQAMRVYEDFKDEKAEAVLLQELLEACEDQGTPSPGVDPSEASLLNSAEHHLPLLGSQVENSGMAIAMQPMLDGQGLDCASQAFDGMHEVVVLSNGHSIGFEEGSALPTSQLPPDMGCGMIVNGNDHWDLLQTLTFEASPLNPTEYQVPLLVSQAENSGMAIDMQPMLADQGFECAPQAFGGIHEGLVTSNGHSVGFQEDSAMPISQPTRDTRCGMCMNSSNHLNLPQIVRNQQELITYLQQQLEESRVRISQLESQNSVQQQLQVINQGVPSFEVEMERRMPRQNHPCSRPHGSAFW